MDFHADLGDSNVFTQMLAKALMVFIKPLLPKLIKAAIDDYLPQKALTAAQLKEVLNIKDDRLFHQIVDRPDFPKIPCGSQYRYWPRAVDQYLTTHNLGMEMAA